MEETNTETILARLDALEKENKELKAKAGVPGGVRVSYSEYQGKPVMELSGSGPPFRFGQAKARMIVAAFEEIKMFSLGGIKA
jgi:hypothetical protein